LPNDLEFELGKSEAYAAEKYAIKNERPFWNIKDNPCLFFATPVTKRSPALSFAAFLSPISIPREVQPMPPQATQVAISASPEDQLRPQHSQLLKKVKILDRVRELQAEAAQEVKETIDKCVAEINEDRRDAKAQGQHSAAISAVMGKAKLLGLVTDKHEDVTSKPDFSKATSLNDVGIKLLQSVGYAEPSPADVALALEAHEHLIAQLEAIAERAQSLSAEQ
jgi:hypothetical protein